MGAHEGGVGLRADGDALPSGWPLAAVGAVAAVVGTSEWFLWVIPRTATVWVHDYGYGVTRRGLAGQTLTWLAGPAGDRTVRVVGELLAYATVAAITVALLGLAVRSDGRMAPNRLAVAAGTLLAAVGVPFLATRAGNLDHPAVLLVVVAAVAVAGGGKGRLLTGTAVLCAAAAVHESALLVGGLWVGALAARQRRSWWPAVATIVPVAAATVALGATRPAIPANQLEAVLAGRTGHPISTMFVEGLYADLGESLAFSWSYFADGWQGPVLLALGAAAAAPVFVACWVALRTAGVTLDVHDRALLATAVAPMALSVIAVDYGRWWAYAALLAAASTLLILRRSDPHGRAPWVPVAAAAVAAPLAGMVSGPTAHQAFLWLHGPLGLG